RPRRRAKREIVRLYSVMDRGQIFERGMPVRIADRHVERPLVVFRIHRNNAWRGEPVNRGDDRRRDQPRVSERQEVEAVVNDVELRRPFEYLRYMQALGNLRIDVRIFGPASRDYAAQDS